VFLAWPEDDQDKALAFDKFDDDRCPGCGNPLSETTDMTFRAEWVAETVGCHACRVKDAKSDRPGPGEYVIVTRRTDG